jgi:hypothetical protein
MLIIDMTAVKLPGEAKQKNLPPECGQPIAVGDKEKECTSLQVLKMDVLFCRTMVFSLPYILSILKC